MSSKLNSYPKFEHTIKYLGTVMSGVYALVLGAILMLIDYNYDFGAIFNLNSLEVYTKLIPIVNVLVSIVIGISLTTFSVIFVVMQLASSQFSPRILRHFLANDIRVQHFIALCVGTVALCILPQLASVFITEKAFLLTLIIATFLAIRCLIWSYPSMITYLSVNMNVSSITHHIKKEVVDEINILYKEKWTIGNDLLYKRKLQENDGGMIKISSPFESGYLESVRYDKMENLLLPVMEKYKILAVYQKPVIGEFIMKDTTVLLQISVNNASEELQNELTEIVKSTFSVNRFRSHTQDINFGVRKLVDIAIKAISPAVNDPTTCLNCIDQIGEILKNLSDRQFPSTDARRLIKKNIHINEFNFDDFVDFCFDQIYQWGKEDPTVVKRILRTIRTIIPFVYNPFHLKVLLQQMDEMELESLYNQNNIDAKNLKISKEKLVSIQHEVKGFKEKAKVQILELKKNGVLDYYLQEHHCINEEVRKEHSKTISYLLNDEL